MIIYDRLWDTLEKKGITNTIDRLCNILHCDITDIMEHIKDDNTFGSSL
jgi:DNA-binding Xre family transcriptional regulator